jgi:hypothetical protein
MKKEKKRPRENSLKEKLSSKMSPSPTQAEKIRRFSSHLIV